jgi:hypothetical protein
VTNDETYPCALKQILIFGSLVLKMGFSEVNLWALGHIATKKADGFLHLSMGKIKKFRS